MSQSPIAADDAELRSDVRRLGDLLGQTLVRQEGPELLALVEEVRKAVREGTGAEILAQLSVEDSVQLVRAFSTYFQLMQSVQVLPQQSLSKLTTSVAKHSSQR